MDRFLKIAVLARFAKASPMEQRSPADGNGGPRMKSMIVALVVAGSVFAHPAGKRTELDGVWILVRSTTDNLKLTPVGEKARASYDFQRDDPDMKCIPASITRIMHTPSPPIEGEQHPDYVEINYEFMDVRRRVPLQ